MMKSILGQALLAALGGLGCGFALFSYFDETSYTYPLLVFFLVGIGSCLLSLYKKKSRSLLAGFFLLFPAAWILAHQTLTESFLAASIPLLNHLKEPYDVEIALPVLPVPSSETPALLFLATGLAWLFLTGFLSKAGQILSALVSLAILFLGFYFGVNPPAISILLLAGYFLSLLTSLRNHGPAHPELPIAALTLICGLLLMVAFPESRYDQPRFLSSMQEKIISFIDPYDPIFHAGNAYTGMMKGADGKQRLGNTPGIRYTGRVIASIETADVSHPLYLRSWVGGVYEKNQWKELPDSDYQPVASLFAKNQGEWYDQGAWLMEVLLRNPAISQKLLNYTQETELSLFRKEFSVDQVYDSSRYFLLPYDADFGAPFFVYDRSPVSTEGKAYSTDVWNLPAGALLSMMQQESISDPYYSTYLGAENEYRKFVYDHYLAIPDSVQEAIQSLGAISKVNTLSEKRARIEEIHHFLETNYTYTTNPGRTPKDKDFISYFLTESKKGYCTSFASAAVMLLRASGIPARYVTGLEVGSDELQEAPLTKEGFHALDINDHHAHAWVEVYVDSLGWRPCEMTPGVDGVENPFPIPPEKQKDETGAPNKPADEKDRRQEAPSPSPQQPQQPQQKPEQQPPSSHPETQPPSDNTSKLQLTPKGVPQGNSNAFSWLLPLLKILLLLVLLSMYPLYRLTAISRLFAKASTSDANWQDFLSYMTRLTTWAGHPLQGSYGAWKEILGNDARFADFPRLIDALLAAKYSGQPLTAEEKQSLVTIVADARKQCLKGLGFVGQVRFRLWEKL